MRVLPLLLTTPTAALATPFFKELGPTKWSIGNELWSIEIGQIYGTKLLYDGKDMVGRQAKGFYAGYGAYPLPLAPLSIEQLLSVC
jgi:hypothetical protein